MLTDGAYALSGLRRANDKYDMAVSQVIVPTFFSSAMFYDFVADRIGTYLTHEKFFVTGSRTRMKRIGQAFNFGVGGNYRFLLDVQAAGHLLKSWQDYYSP